MLLKEIVKKMIPPVVFEQPGYFSRDEKRIKALKNKFKGQRCFILGNGPSLNLCDLSLLDNEKSFAVNSIYYKTEEMGYKPTFYVVEDKHVIKDNLKEINAYSAPYMFFPSIVKSQLDKGENRYFANLDYSFYVSTSKNFENSQFSFDCEKKIYCGQSVTMLNLQLAYYLGFTEVYLIGMDFSYAVPASVIKNGNVWESTEDDVNHFHPNYFGKGKKWHDPKLHNVLKSYELCKEIFEKDGRKIYNATVGGKLELFERVDYNSLFK
jgi:hypothetical protein